MLSGRRVQSYTLVLDSQGPWDWSILHQPSWVVTLVEGCSEEVLFQEVLAVLCREAKRTVHVTQHLLPY